MCVDKEKCPLKVNGKVLEDYKCCGCVVRPCSHYWEMDPRETCWGCRR